jgi:molybdopterin/thiamine biosynthesis adenylyltransferase
MTRKYIKMPHGGLIRKTTGKLKLFLAENTTTQIPEHVFDFAVRQSDYDPENNRTDYKLQLFGIHKIAGLDVTAFGAGSVGCYLCHFLGAAQLRLNVIDFKNVEAKHTQGGRTVYEATQIGLNKVDALKQKIERDHLGCSVNPLAFNVGEIPDNELKSLFARSALVIIAIDDPAQILRINDLAYPIVEFIQVALHRGAQSGHIAISIPFVTPCLRCTLGINGHEDIHRLDSEPANSFDIVTAAQLAAKIAVDILYSKATGQDITRWDTAKNLIYIANTRQTLSPEGPGIIMEGSSKRPDCPICRQQ